MRFIRPVSEPVIGPKMELVQPWWIMTVEENGQVGQYKLHCDDYEEFIKGFHSTLIFVSGIDVLKMKPNTSPVPCGTPGVGPGSMVGNASGPGP